MRAELEHIKTSTSITVGKLGREVSRNYTRLQAFNISTSPEPSSNSRMTKTASDIANNRMTKTASDRHSVPHRTLIETSQSPIRRKLIRMRTPTTALTKTKTNL